MTTNEIFDLITLMLFLVAPFVLAWAMLTRTVYWTFLGRALLGWVLVIGLVFANAVIWRVKSGYVPADDGQPEWWRMAIRAIAIVAAISAVVAVIRSPQSDDLPGRVRWSSLFGRAEAITRRGQEATRVEASADRHEQATDDQEAATQRMTDHMGRDDAGAAREVRDVERESRAIERDERAIEREDRAIERMDRDDVETLRS